MSPDLDIVVYLVDEWDTFHRRPMLTAFAKNAEGFARLICLEPPICLPLAMLLQRQRYRRWRARQKLRHLLPNVWVYSPFVYVPCRISEGRFGTWFCQRMVRQQLGRVLAEIGDGRHRRVAWVFRPEQYRWLSVAKEECVLYECYDEYCLDSYTAQPIPQAKEDESRLLAQAHIVLTTSTSLWQKRHQVHRNVHLVPNGVDLDLFRQARYDKAALPSDLAGIKRPVVGYAGRLSRFIDWQLLSYLAESRPEWSFVLLGAFPEGIPEATALRPKANVHFLGWKPQDMVPAYSMGFDIAILPFLINEYLHCSNPLTLWEQLAVGNVVVASDLHEIRQLEEFVYLASSKEQFLCRIESALWTDNSWRIDKGMAAASKHSWRETTKNVVRLLAETMAEGSRESTKR
ncbi:MAG: glycosyltransferase [Chloroflexi bacterium]|nr:glycosyltransferase [Chloroflexota bacterium]